MKTKEFVAKIKELGYHAETEGDAIVVKVLSPHLGAPSDVHGWFKIKNITKNAYLVINEGRLIPQSDAKVLLAIAEYLSTPLEEREELKKYYLRFPKGYNRWYSYLAKEIDVNNGEYDCTGKFIDYTKYQNTFTQKEIDAMPFDTNFFVKEEVK